MCNLRVKRAIHEVRKESVALEIYIFSNATYGVRSMEDIFMSVISIPNLADAKPQEPLTNGIYEIEVGPSTQVITRDSGDLALQVEFLVVGGPSQPDGSEPEGRKSMDWFQLTGTETHKDGGRFAKVRLNQFLSAAEYEFDESKIDLEDMVEELRGVQIVAINQLRKNNVGEKQENWKGFKVNSQ